MIYKIPHAKSNKAIVKYIGDSVSILETTRAVKSIETENRIVVTKDKDSNFWMGTEIQFGEKTVRNWDIIWVSYGCT